MKLLFENWRKYLKENDEPEEASPEESGEEQDMKDKIIEMFPSSPEQAVHLAETYGFDDLITPELVMKTVANTVSLGHTWRTSSHYIDDFQNLFCSNNYFTAESWEEYRQKQTPQARTHMDRERRDRNQSINLDQDFTKSGFEVMQVLNFLGNNSIMAVISDTESINTMLAMPSWWINIAVLYAGGNYYSVSTTGSSVRAKDPAALYLLEFREVLDLIVNRQVPAVGFKVKFNDRQPVFVAEHETRDGESLESIFGDKGDWNRAKTWSEWLELVAKTPEARIHPCTGTEERP